MQSLSAEFYRTEATSEMNDILAHAAARIISNHLSGISGGGWLWGLIRFSNVVDAMLPLGALETSLVANMA